MSDKSDIIEGSKAATARNGLVYTCLCGWIDLGHARPDGAGKLLDTVKDEIGERSANGRWFRVRGQQCMGKFGLSDCYTADYAVKLGMPDSDKNSVALEIFMQTSLGFESLQNSWMYSWRNSGFSAEDLASNILGFYRALDPKGDLVTRCVPVSKKASEAIWDKYGEVGKNKNESFGAFLYPCPECSGSSQSGPMCVPLPDFLDTVKPTNDPEKLRKWNPADLAQSSKAQSASLRYLAPTDVRAGRMG